MPASDSDMDNIVKAPTPPEVSQSPLSNYINCYERISPYNPTVYKCTGYSNEPWEWFDGAPGSDSRFTIDLENGSTDKYFNSLRDCA
jgi:hypothetical protein